MSRWRSPWWFRKATFMNVEYRKVAFLNFGRRYS
jgi:hypothetical protein